MRKKIKCIMLIDDNADDNFFHERVINKGGYAEHVVAVSSGNEGLEFLKSRQNHPDRHPELIFLDINMSGMNGWEFLEEYNKLSDSEKGRVVIVMLTTSTNPEDREKSKAFGVIANFLIKPLNPTMLEEILRTHFPECF